jgi:peroxiredoxin
MDVAPYAKEYVGCHTHGSEEARAAAKASGSDAASANIDGTDDVPMPTTLVVDASRVVRWADVHPDFSMRSEPADIITAVRRYLGIR